MLRIKCLKCSKFFNSEDKKINRLCAQCKTANRHFDSSADLTSAHRSSRHRHNA